MGAAEKTYSFAEYLALEADTGQKYEYYDGFLVGMAGGTLLHAKIGGNIAAAFHAALKHKPCESFTSDARIAIEEANSYLYPDAAVACPPFEMVKDVALANPVVLVEVLSDSSERYDRGDKFRLYRQIHSLQHFLLVSQTQPLVEMYSRNAEGFWVLSEAADKNASLYLSAIEVNLSLEDIYWKVTWEQPKPA